MTGKVVAFRFFDDFILVYPLYAVLFAQHGLSASEISLLFVVWSVTGFALEVPTGVLADRFSRRHVLAIGQVVRAAGYLIWWLAPGFPGYAIGFVFWGAQGALESGAFQALVYDELHTKGETDRYPRIMGLGEASSSTAQVVGSLLAAAIIPLGFGAILVASSAACLVAGALIFTFPAAPAVGTAGDSRYLLLLRDGVREVVRNRTTLGFVLFTGVVIGLGSVDEFYGLILRDSGLGKEGISLWSAALFGAGIVGSLVAHRVARGGLRPMVAVTLAGAVALIAASEVPGGVVPVTLIVAQGVLALQMVAFDARLQGMITTGARATVTSVHGFVMELGAIAAFLGFGAVATATSSRTAAGVIGVAVAVVVAVALVGWWIARRRSGGSMAG